MIFFRWTLKHLHPQIVCVCAPQSKRCVTRSAQCVASCAATHVRCVLVSAFIQPQSVSAVLLSSFEFRLFSSSCVRTDGRGVTFILVFFCSSLNPPKIPQGSCEYVQSETEWVLILLTGVTENAVNRWRKSDLQRSTLSYHRTGRRDARGQCKNGNECGTGRTGRRRKGKGKVHLITSHEGPEGE